jgi:hypothetical protein
MYYNITKEAIDAMMSSPGEIRGLILKKDLEYILQRGGEKKKKSVEEELAEMGDSFFYKDIAKNNFYPWGRRVLSLVAISRVFNMEKENVERMGEMSERKSLLRKLTSRYFFTAEDALQKVVKEWRKNHTIGRLEIIKVDEKEKKAVIRLYNLNFHPIFCDYLVGYFKQVIKNATGEFVKGGEEKCFFKGESFFHEFSFEW